MKKLITLIISLSFSVNSLGTTCSQPVVHLNEGDKASCTGYLFSPEQELAVRQANEVMKVTNQELDLKNAMVVKYQSMVNNANSIIDEESQKAELWRTRAIDSTQKLVETQHLTKIENIMWFVGGVLAAAASGYVMVRAGR